MSDVVYQVTLFGLELKLKPVAFTLPIGKGWDIYWYGILISLGFLLALIYAMRRAKALDVDPDRMIDVVLVSTPVAVIGARAYYLLFDGQKMNGIGGFFNIHEGGLAIYGGVIGAFAAAAVMCRVRKVNLLSLLDLGSLGFLIGQAVGRWGNFFNQEAYGSLTGSSWWGMTSDKIQNEYGYGLVHPCFLYESLWCILGFILLHRLSLRRKFKGEIFLAYGVWYGFGRFFIEGLRTDSLMLFGTGIRVSQVVSLLAVLVCAALLIILFRKQKDAVPAEYTPLFTDELESLENEESVTGSEGDAAGDATSGDAASQPELSGEEAGPSAESGSDSPVEDSAPTEDQNNSEQ